MESVMHMESRCIIGKFIWISWNITRRYVIINLIIIFWNDLCEFLLLLIFSRQWNTSNYLLTWKGHCTRSDAQNFLLQMYSEHAAVQFTPFVIWEMGRQTRKEILRLAIFKFLSYSLLQYKLARVSKPSKMFVPKMWNSQIFSMKFLMLKNYIITCIFSVLISSE